MIGRLVLLALVALFIWIAYQESDDPVALGLFGLVITTLLICYRACT